MPNCYVAPGRTVQVGTSVAGDWSSSNEGDVDKICENVYDGTFTTRSPKCADNCGGCYEITTDSKGNKFGHICKKSHQTDSDRVCEKDRECHP